MNVISGEIEAPKRVCTDEALRKWYRRLLWHVRQRGGSCTIIERDFRDCLGVKVIVTCTKRAEPGILKYLCRYASYTLSTKTEYLVR